MVPKWVEKGPLESPKHVKWQLNERKTLFQKYPFTSPCLFPLTCKKTVSLCKYIDNNRVSLMRVYIIYDLAFRYFFWSCRPYIDRFLITIWSLLGHLLVFSPIGLYIDLWLSPQSPGPTAAVWIVLRLPLELWERPFHRQHQLKLQSIGSTQLHNHYCLPALWHALTPQSLCPADVGLIWDLV